MTPIGIKTILFLRAHLNVLKPCRYTCKGFPCDARCRCIELCGYEISNYDASVDALSLKSKPQALNQRFYSLDIFRGATVAGMILVNNPGSWGNLYEPLGHAKWHGITPTDLVFPFFLFAVGNALSFVMPRLEQQGTSRVLGKILKRTILIFLIGLFLTWFPFVSWKGTELSFKHWVDPENPENGIRILGVLQRIALSYLFASLIIYFFKLKGAFAFGAILLLLYWALCVIFGQPGDPYSMNGFFGTELDKQILGIPHMYKGEGVPFDPEGLASTIPSISQVIFGYLAGYYIQSKGKNFEMLSHLFVAGILLLFAGYCMDSVFPINKKIWTSSYVLYTTGLAIVILAVLIHIVEMKGIKSPAFKFFDVFGKNPLFIYVLSGLIPKTLSLIRWEDHVNEEGNTVYTSPLSWFYKQVCEPLFSNPKNASLLYAITLVVFFWLIGYMLDKKRIYIKV